MNPPFTSNTKHYDAGDGVLNAAFAAYDSSETDQKQMASRLRQLAKDSTYHGHAGLASAFVQLCHRKLNPGGVIAMVLPFTAINGSSWAKFRKLIATEYMGVNVVSIAANGKDMSFSSDTGMAECLLIGRKSTSQEDSSKFRTHFTSLERRPQGFAHAVAIANDIVDDRSIRTIEDGPFGGAALTIGNEVAGESLDAPTHEYAVGWGAARISDASVAQVAHLLSVGKLWLPAESDATSLPVAELKELGQRGVDHQLIVSVAHRGPFTKGPASPTATYPSLWNHHSKAEKFMVCRPDMGLRVRAGMEARAGGTMDDRQSRPRKSRVHIWCPAPCHCIYRTGVYRRNSVAQRNL